MGWQEIRSNPAVMGMKSTVLRYYCRNGDDTYDVTAGMGMTICGNIAGTCPSSAGSKLGLVWRISPSPHFLPLPSSCLPSLPSFYLPLFPFPLYLLLPPFLSPLSLPPSLSPPSPIPFPACLPLEVGPFLPPFFLLPPFLYTLSLPPSLSPPSPFPSLHRSLRSRTPLFQLGGLWERCKLHQRV